MALWNSTDCGLQNAVIGTPDYGSWGNTAHGTALGPGLDGSKPTMLHMERINPSRTLQPALHSSHRY